MPICLKPIDCKHIRWNQIRSVDRPRVSGWTLSSVPSKDLMADN